MKRYLFIKRNLLFILLLACGGISGQVNRIHDLMPVPLHINAGIGKMNISKDFRVSIKGNPDPRLYAEASRFVRRVGEKTGLFLDGQGFVTAKDSSANAALVIRVQRPGKLDISEDESYSIEINDGQALLSATNDLGAIHGLETFIQLISNDENGYYFPCLSIKDQPRFAWRGLLLDVALHFMPVDMIYRTLDGMCAVKLNVLHLHLANDQGFRVESKVFPRLQQVASDGKYYTQQHIREIIAYASQRGIRIVPEFVVPAHTTAILTAFPELGSEVSKGSVPRRYSLQRYFGVFDPVLDPTNEKVYVFLDKLFGEMTALFPDRYFHIGGDENTGKDWENNPRIHEYMKAHGMKKYMDLQTEFNKRLLPIVRKYHKIMMGWDEILQPGVPKDIVIQSWRGSDAFYSSVREGFKAILSNGYYIDLIQPASFHYLNDPEPDSVSFTEAQKKNILGGEATMWSELITPETVDSRIWPRSAAIAERLWSAKEIRDVDDMYRRLDIVSLVLEQLGLRHEIYKGAMLRRLANGYDIDALKTLVDVIEPLKIYERNEGDTMYTVFSPYTKIADAATPDQKLPREFNKKIDKYLKTFTPALANEIAVQLSVWKDNHVRFLKILKNSPVLHEAEPLSENLSRLAASGIEALGYLNRNQKPVAGWFEKQSVVIKNAKVQGGRCELQVVEPIEKLIKAAAGGDTAIAALSSYRDEKFIQEYHEAYPVGDSPELNNVRSIAVDRNKTVWIANAKGVFYKKDGDKKWQQIIFPDNDKGSAYKVVIDKNNLPWFGTWNGIYNYHNGSLKKIKGTEGPVSLLCAATEGVYALGPAGIWLSTENNLVKKNWRIARSLRDVVSDGKGGLWIASDVGLYYCDSKGAKHFSGTSSLISAALKGLAFDNKNKLWAAGLGGITLLQDGIKKQEIKTEDGCPTVYTHTVRRDPDGSMWVGTQVGVVRYAPDGSHSLRFSRRWLLDDQVNDIAFDDSGNAWIATAKGVSAIKRKTISLEEKQQYFYDVLMRRHIREPWIAGQCHLKVAGDTTTWSPEDDDNDGEYGGNYLTMESFRYAVTRDEDARKKAAKAFAFLKTLREITGGDGYFARSIVPVNWDKDLHDTNRTYTEEEKADELVKEPRFKPVETRWRKSKDGQWLWKGDASSDEWCGHVMGYYFYYILAADEPEKAQVRDHVSKIVDHLLENDFNMMDVDGTHTRWSVWSPSSLNEDPEWQPDQSENSMELLAFLKLAYFMTGKQKYQDNYLKLINEYHYLDNMAKLTQQNPAWFVYYDVIMQCYLYPILVGCEEDPKLKAWYEEHMDNWMKGRVDDHNPLINFLYCYARNKKVELNNSIDFLKDTPLDLVCWHFDHTKREDVKIVHRPDISEFQVSELPPASIRAAVRWDANPWLAVSGNPHVEREPVFWLLPYWIGRYLKMIN